MDAALWTRCKAGDADSRCALIERYMELAARIARNVRAPAGTVVGPDDLKSAGLVGLISAVDRFQPERGVPFEAYAALRIRGAIIDELRRADERGRHHEDLSPSVSLDRLLARGYAPFVAPDELAGRYDHEDLLMRVEAALRCLPPRQREVLARYYGDELTLREAGVRMGISEARACQLHGRAIHNLRRQLASGFASVAAA